MEIKNITQAMKLQKELSAKLAANLDKLRGEKAPTLAATLREQEKLVVEAKNELANTEKAREVSLKSWDMKIEQRKVTVERMEKGLQDMKRKLDEAKKGGGKNIVRPKKKPATRQKKKS